MLGDLLDRIIDLILGLEGGVAYALVTVLTWAEAAFFLGLVTPGEIAMVLGGVIASLDQADVVVMAALAASGTVAGNSTGYWLGRRYGRRIMERDRVARRFGGRFEQVEGYFEERGGWAIVVGRFASFLRVFVPFVAGSARMPYGRFLLFDVPTSVGWATGFVVAGFLLGRSWEVVRGWVGPAGGLVLALIAVGLLIRWASRWAADRRDLFVGIVRRLRGSPPVRFVEDRYGRQLRWLVRRLDPRLAQGLGLTLSFVVLLGGLVLLGLILDAVVNLEATNRLDLLFIGWVDRSTTGVMDAVAVAITNATDVPWVLVPVGVLVGLVAWRAGFEEASRIMLGVGGAAGAAWLLDATLPPGTAGTQLPVVPVAVVTALVVHIAGLRGTRGGWQAGVTAAAIGSFAVVVVGLSTVVAAEGAPTGIAVAVAIGLAWSASLEVERRLPARLTATEVTDER